MEGRNGHRSNYLHIIRWEQSAVCPLHIHKPHTHRHTHTQGSRCCYNLLFGLLKLSLCYKCPVGSLDIFAHFWVRTNDTTTASCLQLQMVHAGVKMAWKLSAVVIFTLLPKYAIHIIMAKTKALKSPPLSMRRSLEPPVLQYNGGVSLCNKLNFSQFTWQCKTSILRISHGKHLKFSVPACHGLEAKSKRLFKHVACWWCCCVHLTVEKTWKSS